MLRSNDFVIKNEACLRQELRSFILSKTVATYISAVPVKLSLLYCTIQKHFSDNNPKFSVVAENRRVHKINK